MQQLKQALVEAARRFARELWVYLALAALLTTIMSVSGGTRDPARISAGFVGNLLLSLSIAASIALGLSLALCTDLLRRCSRNVRALFTSSTFVACVLLGVELGLFAIAKFLPSLAPHFPRREVWIVALPVSLVMVGIGFVKQQASEAREQRLEAERKLAEARLDALSARTDPHFLFNSLNSIVALIDEDPRAAERAMISLAAMFRYVLEGSRANMVNLTDELSFVHSYLGLEKLRFGERMQVSIDVETGLDAVKVPPLLLQPLVENALRHGTKGRGGSVRVVLRVTSTNQHLELSVEDDGPGPERSGHRGTGTSQNDLRTRLSLMYGSRATFETGPSSLGGFRASIRVPKVSS